LTPTGDKVSLSNYHGNVIVLYFWASWYAPSTKPMPQLQHIADLFKGRNVTVIALCVLDDKTKADAWISKHKQYTFPILIDPVGRGKDPITSQFEVTLIPTTVVIGSGGAIRASVTGMPESSVISLVKSIAAPARPVAKKRPSSVPFGATHHDPLKAGEMLVHGVVMEDSDSSGSFPLSAAWAVLPSGSIVVFPAARSKTVVIDLQTVLKIGDAQQSNTSLKQGMEIDVYGRDAGTGEPLTARLITAAP
jgi:peroxiredoxin